MTDAELSVLLSRVQFGLTIGFHYIFPPLNIGLGVLMVAMEGFYIRTGKVIYKELARFWALNFGLMFALGVASGIQRVAAAPSSATTPVRPLCGVDGVPFSGTLLAGRPPGFGPGWRYAPRACLFVIILVAIRCGRLVLRAHCVSSSMTPAIPIPHHIQVARCSSVWPAAGSGIAIIRKSQKGALIHPRDFLIIASSWFIWTWVSSSSSSCTSWSTVTADP